MIKWKTFFFFFFLFSTMKCTGDNTRFVDAPSWLWSHICFICGLIYGAVYHNNLDYDPLSVTELLSQGSLASWLSVWRFCISIFLLLRITKLIWDLPTRNDCDCLLDLFVYLYFLLRITKVIWDLFTGVIMIAYLIFSYFYFFIFLLRITKIICDLPRRTECQLEC